MNPTPDPSRIAALNDAFRRTFVGGQVILTPGIQALPTDGQQALLAAVQGFHTFTEDNDPYGEHDFGVVTLQGQQFFWKLDYYDLSMEAGSQNPADPQQTRRVLTIMRADEY